MAKYRLNILADYYQFYIQDEHASGDLSESWNDEAVKNMLALAPGIIGIRTINNTEVPVEIIIISDSIPQDDPTTYDKINECNIEVPSGTLVIAGTSDCFSSAKRIKVVPGIYRVKIYYQKLDSINEDAYKIILWKSDEVQASIS